MVFDCVYGSAKIPKAVVKFNHKSRQKTSFDFRGGS